MLAIKREVEHEGVMTIKLVKMCDAMADQACDGDKHAFEIIANRIEGKAMQPVDVAEDKVVNITIRKFTDAEPGDWDKRVAEKRKQEETRH
jgi:hypothetical protein|tara:strand:- start:547 stop:819 length:273 start_codon:yes stop_codon:yes gene_type:complete